MQWVYSGREATVEGVKQCVEPGWGAIIERLVADLNALGWDGNICQVKEKFGALRFYIVEGTSEIFERIHQAEKESAVTCEFCGKPGRITGKSWLKAVCAECERGPND